MLKRSTRTPERLDGKANDADRVIAVVVDGLNKDEPGNDERDTECCETECCAATRMPKRNEL